VEPPNGVVERCRPADEVVLAQGDAVSTAAADLAPRRPPRGRKRADMVELGMPVGERLLFAGGATVPAY
jgi:hypothetical protein